MKLQFFHTFTDAARLWAAPNQTADLDVLQFLLDGYLAGEFWPVSLPTVKGDNYPRAGKRINGRLMPDPAGGDPHPTERRPGVPCGAFTRLDFVRAALSEFSQLPSSARRQVRRRGYRGLQGLPLGAYGQDFIDTYVRPLNVRRDNLLQWSDRHGWSVPPGFRHSQQGASDVKNGDGALLPTGSVLRRLPAPPFNAGTQAEGALDHFSETYWNAHQLLGWVYLRDRDFVNRWGGDEAHTQSGVLSLAEMMGGTAHDESLCPTPEAARLSALHFLRAGKLKSSGLKNGKGPAVDLGPDDWSRLDLSLTVNDLLYAASRDPLLHIEDNENPIWRELRFARADALRAWPDPLVFTPRYKTTAARELPIVDAARIWQERTGLPEREAKEDVVQAVQDYSLRASLWSIERDGSRKRFDLETLKGEAIRKLSVEHINWATSQFRHSIPGAFLSYTLEIEVSRQCLDNLILQIAGLSEEPANLPPEDADITPLKVILEEIQDIRDWIQSPAHTLEDCICYLMNIHAKALSDLDMTRHDFERFKRLALGAIAAGILRETKEGDPHWIKCGDFIAWAHTVDLGVYCENLSLLQAALGADSGDDTDNPSAAALLTLPRRSRKRSVEVDAKLKSKINAVLATANRMYPPGRSRASHAAIGNELARQKNLKLGYSSETIRKILDGKLNAQIRLEIPGRARSGSDT